MSCVATNFNPAQFDQLKESQQTTEAPILDGQVVTEQHLLEVEKELGKNVSKKLSEVKPGEYQTLQHIRG